MLSIAAGSGEPGAGSRRRAVRRGGEVGEDRVDGLLGVLLVRADHAGGAALDPADDVLAGEGGPGGGVDDAAVGVGDHAGALVEGDAGEGDAAVADRAEDEARGDRLVLGRWAARAGRRRGPGELVADQLHAR